MAASRGVACPTDRNTFGDLSEHHPFGQAAEAAGDYAEDLAAGMLATTLRVEEFDPETGWDNKRELWKISDQVARTRSIT